MENVLVAIAQLLPSYVLRDFVRMAGRAVQFTRI